jgi:hypothetical protein
LLRILAILLLLFFFPARHCLAAQVQLAWNASDDSAVTGYKVYYGAQSRTYTSVVDAKDNLSEALSGISETQSNYFAVTAYSPDAESDFSSELVCYGISVAPPTNGQILPGSTVLAANSSQTMSIVPNSGYVITNVLVDGSSVGAVSQYTFSNLSGNHTISAVFGTTSYTISASSQGNGTISPSGSVSVGAGQSQTFTITPASNYNIAGVTVDGASVGAVSSYTFPSVAGNHTIAAAFSQTQYTISSSVQSGNGTISPSGTMTFSQGQSQTYTITPASNYKIAQVTVDGTSVGAVSSYSFSSISGNHTITAAFTATNYTIYGSAQGRGNISPNGSVNVALGNSQSFKISPMVNNKISEVIVDGASVGAVSSYNFSDVSANHTITAVFTGSYEISASVKGNGSISPAGNISVSTGESMTYTMTPATNYQIAGVIVDGVSVGAVSTYTFSNLTANHKIQATFTPIVHTITAAVQGNGTISPSGTVQVTAGTGKTYKISAASRQKIADVAVDGSSVGPVSKYVFSSVAADHNIMATFTPVTYTISASAQGNGTISPAGSVSVPYNNSQTYTITPSANYKVAQVKVDGRSVGAVSSYTFTGISANHSITATFVPITFTISASAQGSGTITPSGSTTVQIGNNQAYTISPSRNYKIADVKVDGTSVGAVSSYQFSSVASNHSITASFAPITYTVSTAVQGNGTILPSGSVSVNSGSTMTFRINPASGYKTAEVLVDGIPAGSISSYTFTGVSGNHTIQANFLSVNPLLVAEAGPVQVVKSGSTVTLNGSNSTSSVIGATSPGQVQDIPSGNGIASYKWIQLSGPSVTLSNPAASVCTFTAPPVTEGAALTFGLTVSSTAGLSASDTCLVDVSGTDLPPSANAGPNQTVSPYAIVTLDGSQSTSDDPAASFQWVQTSGPAVTINYADTPRATFIAPDPGFAGGTLGFELTVTNTSGLQMTDQCLVNVSVAEGLPAANAGPDQTVCNNETVVLNGSATTDENGGIASYRWTQLSGSPVTLSDPTASNTTFTAPDPTSGSLELLFMLTVTDEGGLSSSAKCFVTVPVTQLSMQTK